MNIFTAFLFLTLVSCVDPSESAILQEKNIEPKIQCDEIKSVSPCSKALIKDFVSIQTYCKNITSEDQSDTCINMVDDFMGTYPYQECKAKTYSSAEGECIHITHELMLQLRMQFELI